MKFYVFAALMALTGLLVAAVPSSSAQIHSALAPLGLLVNDS